MEEMEVITRFQAWMQESGKTQRALAKDLGVTPGYISACIKGRKGFSGRFYREMYRAGYGRALYSIMTGEEFDAETALRDELSRAKDLIESLERILKK